MKGAARRFVNFDNRSAQPNFATRDREGRREIRMKPLHDWINRATQNGVNRATHAGVTDEGGAAGKDLFVGSLDMRMGAQNSGNPAVQEAAHRDFFARRLT